MRDHEARSRRPPLTPASLDELALAYVGRFATTRAKLRQYLQRKVRERGWGGAEPPDLVGLADRCARLGYVDDRAYAVGRSRSLSARGFGPRRVSQALQAAGVEGDDRTDAANLASQEAVDAAIRFARRRRLGPFAEASPDPRARERALAAMIRAGHAFALAKTIIDMRPGTEPDPADLRQRLGVEAV